MQKNSTYGEGTFWNSARALVSSNNYYGSNVIGVTSGETITRSYTGTSANHFLRKDGTTTSVSDGGSPKRGVTVIVPDGCIRYVFNISNNLAPNTIQVVVGSQLPETYEPYGYKIPVVCGEATTNIYLDEPLNENESISMSDTGIAIPTINGTNVLTVDTEVQPSNIYIKYGGSSNVNQSLMKYLEYKYKFAKE